MKREKHEAIVLQTWPSKERDKLVAFVTPDRGKLRGWAYGARSARNRFGASLEPLAKVRIEIFTREADETVRIENVDLIRSMFPAQQSLRSGISLTYISELVETFTQSDEPSDLVFRLVDSLCEAMLEKIDPTLVVLYSEVWMLKIAGLLPSMTVCAMCGETLELPLAYDGAHGGFACRNCSGSQVDKLPNDVSRLLSRILKSPVRNLAENPPSGQDVVELRHLAGRLRREFLGKELKSYELLQTVLLGAGPGTRV